MSKNRVRAAIKGRHGQNDRPPIQRLRPHVLHFFDTNFLVLPEESLPLLKHVPERPRWITETVREEVLEKLGIDEVEKAITPRFNTLRFDDLYRKSPDVCPVYYWYILAMYNPANVGGREFFEELFGSRLIKNNVTAEDRKQYQDLRRRSPLNITHYIPNPEPDSLKFLQEVTSRTRKKARRALQDRHPSYIRDIKSLAISLYHCLSSRQNLIYYTCDGDLISVFLKWMDSITMWMTLNHFVLPKLGIIEKRSLMEGYTVDMVLSAAEFIGHRVKLFGGFLDDRRKEKACRFTIKHWDQNERKFHEDVYLWFEDVVANGLSNAHGPLSCYFTRNSEFGNWLHLHYHWPPADGDEGGLRVQVTQKRIVNRASTFVAPDEHARLCRYRLDDASGDMSAWSQFV